MLTGVGMFYVYGFCLLVKAYVYCAVLFDLFMYLHDTLDSYSRVVFVIAGF